MKTSRADSFEIVQAEPDFAEVLAPGGGMADGHAAERVRAHLAASQAFGRISLAHAIAAGWELAIQKASLGWGGWRSWCRQRLGCSTDTADRYIELYTRTVGAMREKIGIAVENALEQGEVSKATLGMEDKTATGVMVALGIVRRSGKWGGPREGSGRPAKGAAEEVEAAAKSPDLNWAEVSGYLKGIREFAVESDGFGTLADDDLESAVVILTEAAERARSLLAARREGEG